MKTCLYLLAVFGSLAVSGPARASESATGATADVEVIVVTAKRLPTPVEADLVATARRAVSGKKPAIALPAIDVQIARFAHDHS